MNDIKKTPMSFRNALSGYNKEDVNRYIQQMNFQFSRADELKNAEIDKLRNELASYREGIAGTDALKEEMERLKQSLDNAEKALAAEKEKYAKDLASAEEAKEYALEALKEEIGLEIKAVKEECASVRVIAEKERDAAKALAEEKEAEAAELSAQLEKLKSEIALLREEGESRKNRTECDDREQKAQRYEKMSSQLGDILLSANADADRIRENAMENADLIRTNAEKEAAELVARTNEKLQIEITEAGERLRAAYRSATADCERIIAGLKDSIASADSAMEARTDAFLTGLLDGDRN